MILDAILGGLIKIATGILGLLPNLGFNADGFGAGLGGTLAAANSVFPVVTLGTCIGAVLACRLFMATFGFFAWLYEKIPFN